MLDEKKLSGLIGEYQKAKEISDSAEADLEAVKKAIKDLMGQFQTAEVGGFKVSYKFDTAIDTAKLEAEHPVVFKKYLKSPELDSTRFRAAEPELTELYLINSKKRPLKIGLA